MTTKSIPQVGDQLRITHNSDPALCTPRETVTVVSVEYDGDKITMMKGEVNE